MFDLLTKEEDALAAAQGWKLTPVYDLASTRWSVLPSPNEVAALLVARAAAGEDLSTKALRLIQAGYEREKPK